MGFLKHATVEGINAALEQRGYLSWPNEKVAMTVCRKVAEQIGGPEEVARVAPDTAVKIARLLKQAHEGLTARGMKTDAALHRKVASERNDEQHCYERAQACVQLKLAEDASDAGSLTNVGKNTPESAAKTDQLAALDQQNRSTMEYVVGVGNTKLPDGMHLGTQMPHPKAPASSPATPSSAAKLAELEQKIAALKLSAEKLAELIVRGKDENVRAAALKVASARSGSDLANKLQDKKAEFPPSGGGAPEATPSAPPAAPPAVPEGGGDPVAEIVDALQSAGIDLNEVHPDDVMQALMMAQGGDVGGAAGAPPPAASPAGPQASGKSESDKDESEKDAAWLTELRKMAEGSDAGSLTNVGKNTPESAAQTDQAAKLDQQNRATGAYVQDVGKSDLGQNGEGQQYAVKDPEKAPTTGPDTTPSRETKSAAQLDEEKEYVAAVQKLASLYAAKLPAAMPRTEKIAHLKNMLALAPQHRAAYVQRLTSR